MVMLLTDCSVCLFLFVCLFGNYVCRVPHMQWMNLDGNPHFMVQWVSIFLASKIIILREELNNGRSKCQTCQIQKCIHYYNYTVVVYGCTFTR